MAIIPLHLLSRILLQRDSSSCEFVWVCFCLSWSTRHQRNIGYIASFFVFFHFSNDRVSLLECFRGDQWFFLSSLLTPYCWAPGASSSWFLLVWAQTVLALWDDKVFPDRSRGKRGVTMSFQCLWFILLCLSLWVSFALGLAPLMGALKVILGFTFAHHVVQKKRELPAFQQKSQKSISLN